MKNEILSDKQSIFLIITFILGTSEITATGLEARKDLWLAIIIAVAATLPIVLVYARLHIIFPGNDLFEMIEICFGTVIGKTINVFVVWFVLHVGAMMLRNYSQFVVNTTLINTPLQVIMISFILLSLWMVKEGIEVMGRWSVFFLPIVIAIIIIAVLLLIPKIEWDYMKPILYNGMRPVMKGAISAFSFPFTETVMFLMIFSHFKNTRSSYKVYVRGLLIGGGLILIISLTQLLVLGEYRMTSTYFTSYKTFRGINIREVIENLEIVIIAVITLAGFMKLSIFLLACCKGVAGLFDCKNYRFIVTPITLLMVNLSYFIHDSVMDFYNWVSKFWHYYALPVLVILPVIILMIGESKKKRSRISKTNI
jgi:spore germination protein KB